MNKILITGVSGHLGSRLAQKLIEDENNLIFGIDNLSNSKMTNLYPLLKNDRFNFLEHDLRTEFTQTIDCIYHLAGSGDNSLYNNDKYNFALDSVQITKNILEYARLSGAKILLTSSFVDYQPANKQQFLLFDTTRLIEDLALEFSSKYHLDCKIARLTNAYGNNMKMDDKRFIPQAIINAYNNENIVIDFDRSDFYTFNSDVINALELIMNNYCDSPIIDVSVQNLHLNSDIAKLIISFTKSKSKIILKTQDVIHPNYKPNLNILNNELNYKCTTPILDGMSKTIDYFRWMYFC